MSARQYTRGGRGGRREAIELFKNFQDEILMMIEHLFGRANGSPDTAAPGALFERAKKMDHVLFVCSFKQDRGVGSARPG